MLERLGWEATCSSATTGEKGGASAGVAVLAKSYRDAGWLGGFCTEAFPARAVAQVLRLRGAGAMVIYSVHMVASEDLVSEANGEILRAV